jgi:hypothetical protein
METTKRYVNYPIGTVILANIVSLSIYGLGLYIISKIGYSFSFLFLVYILIFEYRLIRNHCSKCFYWGKICGFGKGRISAMFFKKADISKFCINEMTWTDMIPDMLLTLIPLVIGIILLIIKFDIDILSAMILLFLFTTTGNAYIRGTLTCKYCKQKELGCPADALFHKEHPTQS